MRRKHMTIALTLLAAMFMATTVGAQPSQQVVARGAVVALRGTPHLWIADDNGQLHWAGDTRALSSRFVNWGDRREVSIGELRAFRTGDPWLSSGLLKIGDPIYLVKWETTETVPTLYHIQSILDVEVFGINATNYGSFVMDKTTWEQRFGMNSDALRRADLAPAVAPAATATPTVTAATATATVSLKAEKKSVTKISDTEYETKIDITGASPNTIIKVSAKVDEWECSPQCLSTVSNSWGPVEAGRTDSSGKLTYTDKHGAYKSYTYTFEDTLGNKATVTVGDDKEV